MKSQFRHPWVVLGLCLTACSAGQVSAQTTLYSDSFSGGAVALDTTLVESGTLQTGSVAWSANSPFQADGSLIGSAGQGSAVLPFVPVVNATYELSLDLQNATERWVGLGFKNSNIAMPGTAGDFAERFSNGGGISWMLYRDHLTDQTQDIQLFGGTDTGNQITDNDTVISNFNQLNTLKIVLDTSGDGSSFTADFLLDQGSGLVSVSSGPQVVNQALSNIQYVGFTYEGLATSPISYDNFLLTQQITGTVPNEWTVDGGGMFSTAGNWTMGAPATNSTVLFGTALSAANSPAVVTLDSPATLAEVQFSNAAASYTLAGPSTLTLAGVAKVSVAAGTHRITAPVDGTTGLVKTGAGTLALSGTNTYSGTTDVQVGALRAEKVGSIPGGVSVTTGATFGFSGDSLGNGYNGAFTGDISGQGEVVMSDTLTTEVVSFSSAKSYTSQTTINGGTLQLSGAGRPGIGDGTTTTRTYVAGNASTGKLALAGGANVSGELLTLGAREGDAIDATHVTSAGSNSWAGNIRGDVGGTQYNIESTSGTLTLSGMISAPDTGARNFVFSGAGNVNITGQLVDLETDDAGNPDELDPVSDLSNVNVLKRGSGKLTISTATDANDDYWQGITTVEAGTLEVRSDGADNGELRSTVTVKSGAVFDVDHFGTYNLIPIAPYEVGIGGGGTVQANSLGIFESATVTPGDGVGTLTVNGSVGLTYFDATDATVPNTGSLNFELGNMPSTVGGTENDLINVSGTLSINNSGIGSNKWQVNVTPAEGSFGTGSNYTLVNAASLNLTSANASQFEAHIVDSQGNALVTRQSASVVFDNAGGDVELQVTGTAASQTWTGATNSTWDKNSTPNWTGTGSVYFDLDNVTFPSGAANKNVVVNTSVAPGSVNFDAGAGTYTVTGNGGLSGGGPVNVNSGTVKLQNKANSYSGATTIAGGARLEMAAATTGDIVTNGTLSVPFNSSLIEDFNGDLSAYTTTRILDVNGGASNTYQWQITNGSLEIATTTYDDIEQSALTRTDVTLEVGEELVANYSPDNVDSQDIGLYVGAGTPTMDVRENYLTVHLRNNGQIFSRGFDGSTEFALAGGDTPATIDSAFIARIGEDVFELGYYDNGVRNIITTRTISDGNAAGIGNAIGFYSDVRGAGVRGNFLDLIKAVSGVLEVDGDFTLAANSTLELDISQFGFSSLDISGEANLAGEISLELLDAFVPAAGTDYALLNTLGGIVDSGFTFDLPALMGGLAWDTTAFATTGVISVIDAGIAGDFDMDGDVDGHDFLLWQRDPAVGNLADWQANYGTPSSVTLNGASAAVPEPSTVLLLLFGMSGLVGRSVASVFRKS